MIGAFGAHGLQSLVTKDELEIWKTGAQYQLVHSVALLALALFDTKGLFRTTMWLWIAGMAIFSGSLYVLVLTHTKILGAITPIGGICLILGWLLLGFRLWKSGKEQN